MSKPEQAAPAPEPQPLPIRASLEHLKNQAKRRLKALRQKDPDAKLTAAQLALAREHGFPSWRALRDFFKARDGSALRASVDADEFLSKVGDGDGEEVRAMLVLNPRLASATGKHPFWGGRPQALHVAVERGQTEMVRLLIESGASVDGENKEYDGWSPLMLAIHWKRNEIREILLAAGVSVSLIEALMLADDQRVKSILCAQPDAARRCGANGATPLHFARSLSAIELLLAAGADLNATDRKGKTPVEYVAESDADMALVQRYIELGAKGAPWMHAAIGDFAWLKKAYAEDTALANDVRVAVAAIENARPEILKWMLDCGLDPNARDARGSQGTLLHAAAWNGDLAATELLLSSGADPNALDAEYKTTPVEWARTALKRLGRTSCHVVVEYLHDRTHVPEQLVEAAQSGSADRLQRLLELFPGLTQTVTGGQWDQPLLHLAAARGHLDCVDILIKRGFDVNLRDKYDNATALHFATEHLPIVKRLVDAGADIHGEGDDHELGVLGWATCFAQTHFETAKFLLERGARLHLFSAIALGDADFVRDLIRNDPSQLRKRMSRNEHHRGPLHHAVAKNRPDMVELLIDLGADVHAVDDTGASPLTYASDKSTDPRILGLLEKAGARLDLLSALRLRRWPAAEDFIQQDPHRIGSEGQETVALHLLVMQDDAEAVTWLIRHGAAVNAKRRMWDCNCTALHVAAEHGRLKMAEILLDAGADPNIRDDKFNATVLGWAEFIGRPEIAKLVKARGGQ